MDFREKYPTLNIANFVFKLFAQLVCSTACQKPAAPLLSLHTVAPEKTKYSEKCLHLQKIDCSESIAADEEV